MGPVILPAGSSYTWIYDAVVNEDDMPVFMYSGGSGAGAGSTSVYGVKVNGL